MDVRFGKRAGGGAEGNSCTVEDAALDFAEDLGRLLGMTQRKAEQWLGQRNNLAERFTRIRDAANSYLQQLTCRTEISPRREPGRCRGRPSSGELSELSSMTAVERQGTAESASAPP